MTATRHRGLRVSRHPGAAALIFHGASVPAPSVVSVQPAMIDGSAGGDGRRACAGCRPVRRDRVDHAGPVTSPQVLRGRSAPDGFGRHAAPCPSMSLDPVDVLRRLGGTRGPTTVLPWTTRHRLWRLTSARPRVVRLCDLAGLYMLPDLPEPEAHRSVRVRGRLAPRQRCPVVAARPRPVCPTRSDVVISRGVATRRRLRRASAITSRAPIETPVDRVRPFSGRFSTARRRCRCRRPWPCARYRLWPCGLVRPEQLLEAARLSRGPGRARRLRVRRRRRLESGERLRVRACAAWSSTRACGLRASARDPIAASHRACRRR